MSTELSRLRMEQTERGLSPYAQLRGLPVPPGGWLRAIREALGRSLRVQATRLGVSAATLHKSEGSEADDRISLGQLRKLAQALDCEVVYGLVPRQPLSKMVQEQADKLARLDVLGVAHSMSLEDQRPSNQFVEQQIAERRQALLSGSWARLWR